jgi:hypothetical protein
MLSHVVVLSQDFSNEYTMHVLIVNTRYSTSMALAYLAAKKGSQSQNNLHEVAPIDADCMINKLPEFLQPSSPVLESPTPCKAHHVVSINRRSDLPEPLHIPTIHLLQWCAESCVIHIFRCM